MQLRGPLALLVPLCGFACSDDPVAAVDSLDASAARPDAAGPKAVELEFVGQVAGEPFRCGSTYTDVGTTHATVTAGDLRFFVHSIRFSKGNGPEVPVTLTELAPWQGSEVGLVDLEDKSGGCAFGTPATNATLRGSVAAGDYDTVAFELGVPDSLNHINVDTAGPPFTASGLSWDWTNGFIHFAAQLDSTAVTSGDGGTPVRVPSFYSHLGSTECSGEVGFASCARKNRPSVRLTGFVPSRDRIVVDLARLFGGSDLDHNTDGTIPGCMSGPNDPECGPLFERMGLDFATGSVSAAHPQVVFASSSR